MKLSHFFILFRSWNRVLCPSTWEIAQLFRNVKDLVEQRIKISAIILWEILLDVRHLCFFFVPFLSIRVFFLCCHKRESAAEKKGSTSPGGVSRTLCRPVRAYSWLNTSGSRALEWLQTELDSTESYYHYSRLSLNGHFYKTDTSVKRTLRAGRCFSLLSLFDSL